MASSVSTSTVLGKQRKNRRNGQSPASVSNRAVHSSCEHVLFSSCYLLSITLLSGYFTNWRCVLFCFNLQSYSQIFLFVCFYFLHAHFCQTQIIFQLLFYCFSFSIPCLLSLYVFQITSLALCFISTCFILPCTDPPTSSDIIRGYGERDWFGMVIIVRELAKPDSPIER